MIKDTSNESLATLVKVANDPLAYAARWKSATGRKVVGCLPMNFPLELIDAAGALPLLLQEGAEAITLGNAIFPVFYCGFTRSIVDQSARGALDFLDGLLFVDNCVQIIGAADVIRAKRPELAVRYIQLDPFMRGDSTRDNGLEAFRQVRAELDNLCGTRISDEAISRSIETFNLNRSMLREIHAMRRTLQAISSRDMQALIKSSMVMDRSEHNALLETILQELRARAPARTTGVRVHLSGHMCQPPKPELLDLIEECGAVVVNDDLYHGFRFISTDVSTGGDPVEALGGWYAERNIHAPCPTRLHGSVRWNDFLLDAARKAEAQGVISLLVKFCEPHMYHYPELNQTLTEAGIPHLLIETEHEGMPLETIRTRIESFVESIRHRQLSRGTGGNAHRHAGGDAAQQTGQEIS